MPIACLVVVSYTLCSHMWQGGNVGCCGMNNVDLCTEVFWEIGKNIVIKGRKISRCGEEIKM